MLMCFFSCDLQLFFTFTLYNTSNHKDRLKVKVLSFFLILIKQKYMLIVWFMIVRLEILQLGVTSSEEAARWIRALLDAALKPGIGLASCSERRWQPFRSAYMK